MNRPRLSTKQRADIIEQHRAGYTIREIADAYGRDPRTIQRVVENDQLDPDAIRAAPPLPVGPRKFKALSERRRW